MGEERDESWKLARNFALGALLGGPVMAFYGAGFDGAMSALLGVLGGLFVGALAFFML